MELKQGVLWVLIAVGISVSVFSEHYRGVLGDTVSLLTVLLVPIFFIILALMFVTGTKVFSFPGIKTAINLLIVLMLIGGVSATLGNDVAQQISGNSVRATDSLFQTDFLTATLFVALGLSFFFVVLKR